MISEKLMPIAWDPKRWWNFCMSEDEKKDKKRFLLRGRKSAFVVYNMAVLKHFGTENSI